MLVDLVNLPVVTPGITGGAPQAAKPRLASAPRIVGVRPQGATPPPDALEARIAALANLSTPASTLPEPDNDGMAGGGRRWRRLCPGRFCAGADPAPLVA